MPPTDTPPDTAVADASEAATLSEVTDSAAPATSPAEGNSEETELNPARPRGRPRTRASDRAEQVRQNMRLYRARRTAELAALGRELEVLSQAVASGDPRQTYAAAAAVVGVWSNSILKDNVIKTKAKRLADGAIGASDPA
ncbi:hypothetical protein [Oryzomicrobium sp.]|uniref:hypothetical protein n=1 Tax=Oryzomicrobium sp. TaxID=1911578 RepID=UPI0025E332CA|nr:hypothetical protein [Oryzomicrobium sp.]MCE1242835.1 hypothetical protein [Oryzomicrobium sp.]